MIYSHAKCGTSSRSDPSERKFFCMQDTVKIWRLQIFDKASIGPVQHTQWVLLTCRFALCWQRVKKTAWSFTYQYERPLMSAHIDVDMASKLKNRQRYMSEIYVTKKWVVQRTRLDPCFYGNSVVVKWHFWSWSP